MKKILFTLALLLSLTVQAQDKTTMEQNMQEVQNYLKECGVFYIKDATARFCSFAGEKKVNF